MLVDQNVLLRRRSNPGDYIFKRPGSLTFYYNFSLSKKVFVGDKLKIIEFKDHPNSITGFKRNKFAMESLLAIGGGALDKLNVCLKYKRVGGSTNDKFSYLSGYTDKSVMSAEFRGSSEEVFLKLFGKEFKGRFSIPTLDEIKRDMRIKFNTYSGCLFKTAGFPKKEGIASYALYEYSYIYDAWRTDFDSDFMPLEIIETASRPKLALIDKIEESVIQFKPLGRVISMPSIMEQMLGFPIYKIVMQGIKKNLCKRRDFIAIGVNRHSDDWSDIGKIIEEADYTYEADWSRFDQTVPVVCIEFAFDVIRQFLHPEDYMTMAYFSNYRTWYFKQMVDKTYLVDRHAILNIKTGIPSGSLMTSVLGSIINFGVLNFLMLDFGIPDFGIIVYGDDHLINFYNTSNDFSKRTEELKEYMVEKSQDMFGMVLKRDEIKIVKGENRFVIYERPVYKPGDYLKNGTRKLKPISKEYSTTPFESFDHSKGTTHRFTYRFTGTISFLKYHFLLHDKKPIRPLIESLIRLVNPERPPRDIGEHKIVLMATLADNRNNIFLRNYIMQMYIDIWHMIPLIDSSTHYVNECYSLWNRHSNYTKQIRTTCGKVGDRVWWRRVKMSGRYEDHPVFQGHLERFDWEFDEMVKIHKTFRHLEDYEMKDIFMIMAKKGVYAESRRGLYKKAKTIPGLLDMGRVKLEDLVADNHERVSDTIESRLGGLGYDFCHMYKREGVASLLWTIRETVGSFK